MQINFNTYKISRPSFAHDERSYNMGFNHGKNDGLVGSRSIQKKDKSIELSTDDYEKGYNNGYNLGKMQRSNDTTTVADVIQDLVNNGKTRKEATEFVAMYLGGW